MDKTVEVQQMQLLPEVRIDIDSYNMTSGIQQGLGPRYGFSPIPGQQDNETIATTRLPGLRAAEGTPAQGFSNRVKVLGILPMKLPDPSDVTKKITTYAWTVTTSVGGTEYFDVVLCSTYTGSAYESISSYIYDGFGYTSYGTATSLNYFADSFVPVSGSRVSNLRTFLQLPATATAYASSVVMSITGPNVPAQWLFGGKTATPDATHAPSVAYHKTSNNMDFGGSAIYTYAGGVPTENNLQNFTTTPRTLRVFSLDATCSVLMTYTVPITQPSASVYKQDIFGVGATTLDLSAVTASKSGGTSYANVRAALVNDSAAVTNSSYKAVLTAAQKPLACIFQDGYRSENTGNNGKTNQWVDLTQNTFQPRVFDSNYAEETISKKTAFSFWPNFVRGTAMVTGSGVSLGGASTGILRANTVYEFTYSIYDKRLNFESNVGVPVKIQTGTNDFICLNINDTVIATATMAQTGTSPIFPIFADYTYSSTSDVGYQSFINHLQYRFYYRQEGTYSWLPALFVDAAQYWFYPWNGKIVACTGAIAALPGGVPGGFNDYSPLAKDSYDCVVQYKDRAWWFSDKQINFSLRNNIFAYPGRNSISAVSGSFRGGIVHNYPGQAEQSSRLVIFGTDTTYVARFSGVRQQTEVQVSANSSGTFDIDASDLVIDPWTSVTAFSYRSAVVADGILFWWGPQGVYRDDGVNTPTKISDLLEPNIFSFYDPNKTDEIFASYNAKTKEITWFYPPKSTSDGQYTRTLVYDTMSQIWLRGQMPFKVDWAQGLNVQSDIGTAGNRVVVGARATPSSTIQRAYFFDERNRAGDLYPTTDWIIKTISTPVTGTRRLTLAAGYDATNFATIAAGDLVALQQTADYTGNGASTASDMVAVVSAVNTGSGYIDITLPTGATLTNTNLQYFNYAPLWVSHVTSAGLNGINYQVPTNYWAPDGINGYFFWLYVYLLLKVDLWYGTANRSLTFSYRTPTSDAYVDDTVTLVDNSDGNAQLYHGLRMGNDNMEGQAIRMKISGFHIGHEWVLQYLEAHGTPRDGDPLKRFEA